MKTQMLVIKGNRTTGGNSLEYCVLPIVPVTHTLKTRCREWVWCGHFSAFSEIEAQSALRQMWDAKMITVLETQDPDTLQLRVCTTPSFGYGMRYRVKEYNRGISKWINNWMKNKS